MPLFKKDEIIGVFKDLLLVRTNIDNAPTLLLVNNTGDIIHNFEGNWFLPENFQDENKLWLYQPFGDPLSPNKITVLQYDFTMKRVKTKSFPINNYFEYSDFRPTINGNYFLCMNLHKDMHLFSFDNDHLTLIKAQNRHFVSFMYDEKTDKVNILEQVLGNWPNTSIKFYQSSISEVENLDAHLKWSKDAKSLQVKEFFSSKSIAFTSSQGFVIQRSQFTDTTSLAAKYDFDGNIVSKFTISQPKHTALLERVSLASDSHRINYIDNTWFLSNSAVASLIYQSNSSEIAINLPDNYLIQNANNLQTSINKHFFFADKAQAISSISTRDLSIKKLNYEIPTAQKSYDIQAVHTLADGSYWLNYASPNGTYIKYNSNDEETYRTPDSVYIYGEKSFYQLNDVDVLIGTYTLKSNEYCPNCNSTFDKYLKINGKSEAQFLDPQKFLAGNPIFYYDKVRKHFYVNDSTLRRYNADAVLDSTFNVDKNISIGSMLVSKQGNIYLGQKFFTYTIDSLYKLDPKGKVSWRKKMIFGEANAYSQIIAASFYGGMYPIYNKDSVIIWGTLLCGEGCYIGNNVALTENEKLVKLSYLANMENNGPATSFVDKYGVFMKNNTTFLVHDTVRNTIEKDVNTLIKVSDYYEQVNSLDVLPNQDLLIIVRNRLLRYSYKKTVWASIENLKKEKNPYNFWNLDVVDAINQQIKLDVFISDSSEAILKVIPENSDVAYLKDQTLFFTGKEGKVAVYAQSINGGEPDISPEFVIQKGTPPYSVYSEGNILYQNTSIKMEFNSVDGISFKIDSVQGSCKVQADKIVATIPTSTDCKVYFSWTGSDLYSAGSSEITLYVRNEMLLANEATIKGINIFPNPLISNMLTIKDPEPINRVTIIDTKGLKTSLFAQQSYSKDGHYFSDFELDTHFSGGSYIVEVLTNNNTIVKRQKVLIAR